MKRMNDAQKNIDSLADQAIYKSQSQQSQPTKELGKCEFKVAFFC